MKKMLTILKDYGIITISCLLYAFSFNCFFQTNDLAMGGFTGIAQVLHRLVPFLPVGITVFVMNVPLMILGVKKEGWKLLFASIYAICVSSLMIDGLAYLVTFPSMDPLLACIYGGGLMGIALGLMMLKSATTGGTELAARLLRYVVKNLSIGKLCLVIDVTVVTIYAITFQSIHNALYGVIAMYVCSLAMDMVVYGSAKAKLTMIISEKVPEITEKLMEMGLGGTILRGRGAYTGRERNVLLCVAKDSKKTKIREVVAAIEPEKAFIIVTDAREVFGEGFGEYSGQQF